MSFSPSTVTANYAAGTVQTISVIATPSDPSVFSGITTLYVQIVDSQGVLNKNFAPSFSINGTSVVETLQTSPTIAAGTYKGNFQVVACSDSSCATQVPGSPWSLPYNIVVTPAVLTAATGQPTAVSASSGGASPAALNFNVQGVGLNWSVATNVPWLQSTVTNGTGAGSFAVNFSTSNLAVGSYTGNVTVSSSDGQSVVTPVTLTVMPVEFDFSTGTATFTAVNGAPITSQSINLSLSNSAADSWTATSSQPWLTLNPASGVTPGALNLGVNPSNGTLASGTYTANATVSSKGVAQASIPVTLNLVKANLTVGGSSAPYGGTLGRSFSNQSLLLSLNTGANAWPWTMGALPAWLSASANSGTVNASGTNFTLTPSSQSAPVGTSTATIYYNAQVNGDTLGTGMVATINVDQHRLLASENGVAFTSIPAWSRLTHNITLTDNYGNAANWTAQSNQPWLTVTPSGTTGATGSVVTLTANPSGLTSNSFNYATVTITSNDPTAQPAIVKVGLWNGTSSPAAATPLALPYAHIVADTVRPYVYVNNAGTSIDVFNVYTAQKVTSITGLGSALSDMTVSGNGDRLYALDTASRKMVVVDLIGQKLLETWPLYAAVKGTGTHLLSVHPNGMEIVMVSDGTSYTGDGTLLGGTGVAESMSATSNSTTMFSSGMQNLDYTAASGGQFLINSVAVQKTSINPIDLVGMGDSDAAISPDGTIGYGTVSTSGPFNCMQYDLTQGNPVSQIGELPGSDYLSGGYLNTVKVGVDGRVYCGAMSGQTYDILMYTAAGAYVKGFKFTNLQGYNNGLIFRQIAISPDGYMVAALSGDPLLEILAVGP